MKKTFTIVALTLFASICFAQNANTKEVKSKGYVGSVELTGGVAVDNKYGSGMVQVATVHGYRFCPYFFAGVGVGYNYNTTIKEHFLPVFLNLRADLMKTAVAPFFSIDTGYAIGFREILGHSNGGFLVNPMFGVKLPTVGSSTVNISVGYSWQSMITDFNLLYSSSSSIISLPFRGEIVRSMVGSLTFKVAVTF